MSFEAAETAYGEGFPSDSGLVLEQVYGSGGSIGVQWLKMEEVLQWVYDEVSSVQR